MYYQSDLSQVSNNDNHPDTLEIRKILDAYLINPPGEEIFYLINSSRPLTKLAQLISEYKNAPQKGKKKRAKKIQNEIDNLNPENKEDLSIINSRLEKPVVAGVTFRGEEEELSVLSLTHYSIGKSGIAFKKILLNHQ